MYDEKEKEKEAHQLSHKDFVSRLLEYDELLESGLRTILKWDLFKEEYRPMFSGEPPMWRLVRQCEDGLEEGVFRFQGVICRKDLPPYDK